MSDIDICPINIGDKIYWKTTRGIRGGPGKVLEFLPDNKFKVDLKVDPHLKDSIASSGRFPIPRKRITHVIHVSSTQESHCDRNHN